MSYRVLVPIKGRDRIEELLPYLEVIARADMKIVFLVHFATYRFTELAGQIITLQNTIPINFSRDTGAPQSILTGRIERASRQLHDHGVQIEVKFYNGRLQPILRQYIEGDTGHPVIMRPARSLVRHLVQSLFAVVRLTAPSPDMPVLLCHPNSLTRK